MAATSPPVANVPASSLSCPWLLECLSLADYAKEWRSFGGTSPVEEKFDEMRFSDVRR